MNTYKYEDLTGKRFGRLIPTKMFRKIDKYGAQRIWYKCDCDCGNTTVVQRSNLTRKRKPIRSCGCMKIDQNDKNLVCDLSSEGHILKYKLSKRNTSGVKGVTYNCNAWIAQINYKYKHYYLCCSKDINDCIKVRKQAEAAVANGTFEQWVTNFKYNKQ